MKYFLKTKNALTLIELVLSLTILSFIIGASTYFFSWVLIKMQNESEKKENLFLISNLQDVVNEAKTKAYFLESCSDKIIFKNQGKNNYFVIHFLENKIFFGYNFDKWKTKFKENFEIKKYFVKQLDNWICKIDIEFLQENEKYVLFL